MVLLFQRGRVLGFSMDWCMVADSSYMHGSKLYHNVDICWISKNSTRFATFLSMYYIIKLLTKRLIFTRPTIFTKPYYKQDLIF